MWVREHEPENFKRISQDPVYEGLRPLPAQPAISRPTAIEAMGCMLLDARTNDLGRKNCCACCGRDRSPTCCRASSSRSDVLAPLTDAGLLAETGLSPDTLVLAGATDTVMEVFASGSDSPWGSRRSNSPPRDASVRSPTARIVHRRFLSPIAIVVPGLVVSRNSATKTVRCLVPLVSRHVRALSKSARESSAQGMDAYALDGRGGGRNRARRKRRSVLSPVSTGRDHAVS